MAEAVGAVRTEATFETAQFEEGTKRARQALGQFDRATKDTGDALTAMGSRVQAASRLVAAAFAAVAGNAVADFITRSVQATAELGRMAAQAGLTAVQFQQLSFAFRDAANVTQEQLATGLGQLQRNLADLNRDTGPFLQFLRDAHPALVDQFRGLTDVNSAMDRLLEVASRIADPMDRMRFLTQAGGEALGRLANAIPEVRRALQQQRESFEGVGDEAVKRAQEIERAWTQLWRRIELAAKGAAVAIAGALTSNDRALTDWAANMEEIGRIQERLARRDANAMRRRFEDQVRYKNCWLLKSECLVRHTPMRTAPRHPRRCLHHEVKPRSTRSVSNPTCSYSWPAAPAPLASRSRNCGVSSSV
jgi:hypothetical protein